MELTNGLRIYLCILFFVCGTVFGSFLNCMAWRIAHHESVLKGRSHCAVCGHTLGAADLIPIFSYLFLRGRCRYCKEKISPRYMAAEVVCGAGFVLSFLRFGLSARTLQIVVLFCILLALSLVDFEIYEIPDRFILAGIVWYIATVWTAGRKLNLHGRRRHQAVLYDKPLSGAGAGVVQPDPVLHHRTDHCRRHEKAEGSVRTGDLTGSLSEPSVWRVICKLVSVTDHVTWERGIRIV